VSRHEGVLPIAEVHDDSKFDPADEEPAQPVCIGLVLRSGSGPAVVRDELRTIQGITTFEVAWAFPLGL
jgi:hypothetical protein